MHSFGTQPSSKVKDSINYFYRLHTGYISPNHTLLIVIIREEVKEKSGQ